MQMKSVYAGRFYSSGVQGRLPRLLERLMVKRLGAVPGIARVQLADLRLAYRMSRLFQHIYTTRRTARQDALSGAVFIGLPRIGVGSSPTTRSVRSQSRRRSTLRHPLPHPPPLRSTARSLTTGPRTADGARSELRPGSRRRRS